MKILWELFIAFAKIGGFTFGGGYAMLPMLKKEVVEKNKWATEDEIMDYYAIGQCTPGIIAVNTATFVGYNTAGIAGGIVATLGVIAPSIVIITIIAAFISNFAELSIVQNAFAGIRVCVFVLVFNTVINLGKKAIVDKVTLAIFMAVFIGSLFTNLSAIVFIIMSAVVSLSVKTLMDKNKEKQEGEK